MPSAIPTQAEPAVAGFEEAAGCSDRAAAPRRADGDRLVDEDRVGGMTRSARARPAVIERLLIAGRAGLRAQLVAAFSCRPRQRSIDALREPEGTTFSAA